MSNFAWWYYSLSFTCSYHFQRLLPYFKVTAMSNSFKWEFFVPIQLSWKFIGLLGMSSRSWIYHLFWWSYILKENKWHISSFERKHWLVLGHRWSKIFKTLHGRNLAWGPHCLWRFDDRDCFKATVVSEILTADYMFWILVLCRLYVGWLLRTWKGSCTIWFVRLVYIQGR